MASIIIQTGERQGDFYPLGQRTTIIGRDEALTVQIKDPHISRKHLKIRYDAESKDYKAADMNSTNGVLINGQKIQVETALADDDLVSTGHRRMTRADLRSSGPMARPMPGADGIVSLPSLKARGGSNQFPLFSAPPLYSIYGPALGVKEANWATSTKPILPPDMCGAAGMPAAAAMRATRVERMKPP